MRFSIAALPIRSDGEPNTMAQHAIQFVRGIYLQPCVTDFWVADSIIMGEDDA